MRRQMKDVELGKVADVVYKCSHCLIRHFTTASFGSSTFYGIVQFRTFMGHTLIMSATGTSLMVLLHLAEILFEPAKSRVAYVTSASNLWNFHVGPIFMLSIGTHASHGCICNVFLNKNKSSQRIVFLTCTTVDKYIFGNLIPF